MGARLITGIMTTGPVFDNKNPANNYFATSLNDPAVFLGWSGVFTGLTWQLQGARTIGGPYYDVATYTTDAVGPLTTPVSVPDGVATAFIGDIRAFSAFQVTVLSFNSVGPLGITLEVLSENFFPPSGALLSAGPSVQGISELRAILSVLQGWLGYPNTQILRNPQQITGTGPGGSYPGGN